MALASARTVLLGLSPVLMLGCASGGESDSPVPASNPVTYAGTDAATDAATSLRDAAEEIPDAAVEVPDASQPVLPSTIQVLSRTPADGAQDVEVGAELLLTFDRALDPASVRANSFRLLEVPSGAVVELRPSLAGAVLRLAPVVRLVFNDSPEDDWDGVRWLGVRTARTYRLEVAEGVRGLDGAPLPAAVLSRFSTEELEHGLYWMEGDGLMEKAHPGKANPFYDPHAPTVIFVHGWQHDMVQHDYRRDNAFFFKAKFYGKADTASLWRDRGFNVGLYYWNQWADEPQVWDAEVKVWNPQAQWKGANGDIVGMRYRVATRRDGKRYDVEFRSHGVNKSVAQYFLEDYAAALTDYRGPEVRLMGHSLGNQLIIGMSHLASEAVQAGRLPEQVVPRRLVLLDPYWSNGGKSYLPGKLTTGEMCVQSIKDLGARHGTVVEEYKTSGVGVVVSDDNIQMREQAAFFRIWPDFIGAVDQAYQHDYAFIWYAASFADPASSDVGRPIGAGASQEDVRWFSNAGKQEPATWSTKNGKDTCTPGDDFFVRSDGVKTM